ncbi:MAG TPA: hypothetical protein VK507_18085, partial [Iamia sp.]|nr:hypothetical protein [Iamia sp.]
MAGWRARAARAVLGLAVLGTTVSAMGQVTPVPAGAATPRTLGEIVVDDVNGHVFVTDGDTVTVHDLDGALVETITGQTGAIDLFLRDGTLYVLATGAERITTVDADSLEVTGGWDLDTPLVQSMAWSGGRIWFTHGDQWGGLGSLDPVTGTVTLSLVTQVRVRAELQATESPARLYVLSRNISPSRLEVYDVSGATPLLLDRAPHSSASCGSGRDLALSLDGTTAWTACGSPYVYTQWDLADLSAPSGTLAATNYPNGIATTTGGYRVGSIQATAANVRLYEPAATTPVKILSVPVRPANGMVAGTAGGERLYVGTQDGAFHTLRLDPVVTTVAPTPVDRGALVTVTGTGMSDVTEAEIGGVTAAVTIV